MDNIRENTELKVTILMNAWNDISKQIETVSGYENRTTVSFVTFMGVITFYTSNNVDNSTLNGVLFSLFIALACIVITSFLSKNRNRLQWLCQSLIRIQSALLMYEPGVYLPENGCKKTYKNENDPLQYCTLFGRTGLDWGITTKYLNSIPHLAMVWLSGVSSIIFILTRV